MVTSDERDRYGEKLRHLEKAREDQWAAQRDQELLEKLRKEALEQGKSAPVRLQLETKVFSRIIWPTDFDQRSLEALELAQKLCVQNDATLHLLHVSPTVSVPLGGVITKAVGDEVLAREKLLSIAAHRLRAIQHEIIVTSGDPATKIVETAEALKAELIVIATHGRQGVPHFFLGSVAERIMREAPCPILAMRCR
jgi:nucleotide-binding universal stress UspA family protein